MFHKIDIESCKVLESVPIFTIPILSTMDLYIGDDLLQIYTHDFDQSFWVSDQLINDDSCTFRVRILDDNEGRTYILYPKSKRLRQGSIHLVNKFDCRSFNLINEPV